MTIMPIRSFASGAWVDPVEPRPIMSAVTGEVIGTGSIKVGLLLPLSGARADVGQAMLNAAQLALFDLASDQFALVVRDTRGTPEGAAAAAEQVLAEEAALILGPLFSTSADAVKPIAEEAAVPMITFSNNTAIAGPQSFVMGVTPSTQVNRVVDYAASQGLSRFAVLAPENAYGQLVVQALQEAVFRNGVELSRVVFYDPQSTDISAEVQVLADFSQRRAARSGATTSSCQGREAERSSPRSPPSRARPRVPAQAQNSSRFTSRPWRSCRSRQASATPGRP